MAEQLRLADSPPTPINGRRHNDSCNCGCGRTEGVEGKLVLSSDTPKLIGFGMAVYRFRPPYSRPLDICYHLTELVNAIG